jgi:hypothetical protein
MNVAAITAFDARVMNFLHSFHSSGVARPERRPQSPVRLREQYGDHQADDEPAATWKSVSIKRMIA